MTKKFNQEESNPEGAALIRKDSDLGWWRGLRFGFCRNMDHCVTHGAWIWGTNVVPDVPCPEEKVLEAWERL